MKPFVKAVPIVRYTFLSPISRKDYEGFDMREAKANIYTKKTMIGREWVKKKGKGKRNDKDNKYPNSSSHLIIRKHENVFVGKGKCKNNGGSLTRQILPMGNAIIGNRRENMK
ncbi:CLUMA_CG012773, isoform A [Clunio marinus]|uniref:CLUMA_CG012773, isoform A n=1 Tax=Clunio marinus TaxID=568069 RepID=A0A1J1ILH7_9DIPT|nr:CLUMA_CG012773, isoform A [Clunio marinus]